MPKSHPWLHKLYRAFWSLYGRVAWDLEGEPAQVSEPSARIVELLRERSTCPDAWVLDARCGTGNYALALAQAGFLVIGVDYAAGMLAKAEGKIAPGLAQRVSFQRADLNAPLAFPEVRFDHIIGISVLQAVTDPTATLREWHRLLKPGGTIVLSLPRPDSGLRSQAVGQVVRYRIRHLKRRTPGAMLLVIAKSLGDRYHGNPTWTAPQAQGMLRATGFVPVALLPGRQLIAIGEKAELPGV